MVKVKIDMTGWVMSEHGVPDSRLTIIRQTDDYVKPNGKREAMWLCECNCEQHTVFPAIGYQIRDGSTRSCGCLALERLIEKCKKYNEYSLTEEYGICFASNTGNQSFFSFEDYDKIKNFCWYEDASTGYMKTKTKDNKFIFMHRLITDNKYGIVDHINRNKLDNRRDNLRDATKQDNALNKDGVISTNTSGYTGVYFSKQHNKWVAQICVNDRIIYLGIFKDKNDAIFTRLEAELKHFGKSAPQRHLFEQYGIKCEEIEI